MNNGKPDPFDCLVGDTNNGSHSPILPSAFDTALEALKLGLSPLVPREDGTKAPRVNWKQFEQQPASEAQVRQWFAGNQSSIGLVTGYNGLECLEFDCRETFLKFLSAALALGLDRLITK